MAAFQFSENTIPAQDLPQRKQLFNHLVDGLAQTRPEAAWAKIPKNELSYDGGYRKVSYKMMANAINGLAWWIKDEIGESKDFETLAYFGTWDPRYILLLLAAVKAGYKMIFPSIGYNIGGLTDLLDGLECKTILLSSKQMDIALKLSHTQWNFHQVPSLAELLDKGYPHFPFIKTFEESRSEPLVVVHTSGTTGAPKPVIWTHDWAAAFVQRNQAVPPNGHASIDYGYHGIECCPATPPNHPSSIWPNLFGAVPNHMVVLYPLPSAPLTTETAIEMICQNNPEFLLAPPHILVGLASDRKYIEAVSSKVSQIGLAGGPLPTATGDILARYFKVYSMYGTSELGLVHKTVPHGPWDSKIWNSLKPHPKDNFEFRPIGNDIYEAVIVRNTDYEEVQPVFKVFPGFEEWHTKDFFVKDPIRDGFWIYGGRIDNIIILSHGGTVDPSGFEETMNMVPFVKRVLMCGTGKPQTALLVELIDSDDSDIFEAVWKAVDGCNQNSGPYAIVARSHVIVTSPDRPIPISAKGSIQRSLALELYAEELEKLYQ
ncbi:Non-canonical non-ribosomal peptide synthetase [Lachnellula willkommii]|uniref:Non-canonical non-ribosomal peptide synthetase n=1 Tax=Lachnellula willkommii TaxID=215461 RepID=A0A559MM36_9HELO|nr:Non-canonical non-ribosomal peptide synthetase [Lachnellula willkommii]